MTPKFGEVYRTKHETYFAIGEVVTHNPQLILDNVNYIGKKNFVIHIKFGQGIARKAILMVKMSGQALPKYLDQTDIRLFERAVADHELELVNLDDKLSGYQFVDELEIEDPADEKIANVASIRENTIQLVEDYLNQLQAKIDKLSQRKANHYFSSKAHYEDVKDFLLSVAPYMDLRLKQSQVRQDEWRLKLRLGGQ
ncbi:hypothetical protein ABC628_05325 [Lentilactobacillus otakiensis]|uniref:Uncharacterized protein n=1 Tax=Lentilactobacillus otakiensis DSM 19908 = JCM 15040 TaxID=1423780 RepID=S4NLN1_9LACO|nr:hypothetical protein [Lentilactobacillus otakiensis]KRL11597.1 hypothetical protein FD05_GL002235 [Lentilactobacillus otakiensis DSM 19908 = JCM 15040]MBZ3776781.1 hypothetical protein [Lentilactobacillus otakiensis]MDV3519312.1 hypothetical protein [Lentilactobacillus otakiensis]GAD16801.1 conserved hypothetical protein [Lentilactobacillus otakiensis DSM 19908 = JCM 15040]